ncbi:hypothetical protein [Nitrosovibrio tenuis]|uniref:Uncharacterized protein n=1 Tax=Nitrosovibrio tenuis TaxID=1233 RepID=A0A1H7KPR1_9PROT|nr:hypothetical protein [Nitrosovibrio tenuis]SEK88759.1 hypothetical protein SAMN05216387_103300 [Nitrosovibrio tenuis]
MADINQVMSLRYDGKDAEKHELDLFSLGVSLQGFARISSHAGTFAITHRYSKYLRSQVVRVAAQEARANCYSIDVVWNFVLQHQILSGSFGMLVATIIPLVLATASRKKDEILHLKDSLDKAIERLASRDQPTMSRLLDTVDRLVIDQRRNARQAFEPIGLSCRTLTVSAGGKSTTFDQADKAASELSPKDEITEMLVFSVLITELDLERFTGKAYVDQFAPPDRRIPITIMDPTVQTQNNAYASSLAAASPLRVLAKGLLKEGKLVRLFVSAAM